MAPAADVAAGALFEPVPGERRGPQLLAERLARARRLERPAVDARHAAGRRIGQQTVDRRRRRPRAAPSAAARRSSAASGVSAVGAGELRRGELAGRDVEKRQAPRLAVAAGRRHGREERRLARVEIRRVGERARRDDARHFALDDALGLARDPRPDRRSRRGSPCARAARGRRRARETARRTSESRCRARPSRATSASARARARPSSASS